MSVRSGPFDALCGVFCWVVGVIVVVAELVDGDCVALELVVVVPVEGALEVVVVEEVVLVVVVELEVVVVLVVDFVVVLVVVVGAATWRLTEAECEREPLVPVTVIVNAPAALLVVVTVIVVPSGYS